MKTVRFSEVVKSSGKPDTHLLLIAPAKDKTLQAAIKSNRVMTVYQESGSSDYGTIGFVEGSSRQFLVFPQTLEPFADKRIIGIKYDLLESIPVSHGETKLKSGEASRAAREPAAAEAGPQSPRPKGKLSDDSPDDVSDEAFSDDRTTPTQSAKSEAVSDVRTMANRGRSRNLSDEASSDLRTVANRGRSRHKAEKSRDEQPKAAPKSLADVLATSTGATTSKKKPAAKAEPADNKSPPPEKVVEFPKPESNQQRSDRSDEVEELKRRIREAIVILEQGKQIAAYNLLKRIVGD
jgi:hypothetical protein